MKKHLLFVVVIFLICVNVKSQILGGTSLRFDGNHDYIQIPDSPELTPSTNQLTIEAWVKSLIDSTTQVIISKYDSNSGSENLSWGLAWLNTGQIRFGVYQSMYIYNTVDTDSSYLKIGEWNHIAATFDLQSQETHIYVNGIDVQLTLAQGSSNISHISDNNVPVLIGAISTLTDGGLIQFWQGNIDEIRIWNIVRSQNQIQSTMNDTLSSAYYSIPDSGLVAYWRCDQL